MEDFPQVGSIHLQRYSHGSLARRKRRGNRGRHRVRKGSEEAVENVLGLSRRGVDRVGAPIPVKASVD